jgi:hypothetical protein
LVEIQEETISVTITDTPEALVSVINVGPPGETLNVLPKDDRITVESGSAPNTILVGTTLPRVITSTGAPPDPTGIDNNTLFFTYV